MNEPQVILPLSHYNKLLRELEALKNIEKTSPERELLETFQRGVPALVRALYQEDLTDYKLQQLLNLCSTRSANFNFVVIQSPNQKAWVQIQRKQPESVRPEST